MKYCRDGHLKTNKRCLLCSPDEQTSLEATTSLIIFLYEHGCKITKEKTHVAESKVIFLGHCISQGTKHLTEERKQAISKVSEPRTKKRVRAFLGLVGYCREWIPNVTELLDPLYEATKGTTKGPVEFNEEQRNCFHKLREAIVSTPAIGLPNYKQPFNLFRHEQNGKAHGVLTQEHGGKQRPLGYYSLKLDSVICGSPSCVRAVAAAATSKDKVQDIVLDHPLVIQVPHAVTEILAQARVCHLSAARLTKYEVALLSPSNITIKRCTTLNPATLLPQEEGLKGGRKADEPAEDAAAGGEADEEDEEDKIHNKKIFS